MALDPRELAARLLPRPDSPYYLTVASPNEYGAVERLSASATREEVAFPLTAATIRWLIDENPAGRGFVVVARSVADDEIVAYFVFYPKTLLVSGRARPIFLYVTLFVAAAFRRVGVFSAMTRYGFDLLPRLGVDFGYTVPNPRSAPVFLKLGNGLLGTVPFWATLIGAVGSLARAVTAPLAGLASRGAHLEAASGFDERHAALVASAAPRARVQGSRSLAELRWRFEQRPGITYEVWNVARGPRLTGYAVTRRMAIQGRDTLVVCDCWAAVGSPSPIPLLLDRARSRPVGERADIAIVIASTSGATSAPVLLASGMVRVPQRFLPQPVAVIGGPMPSDRPVDAWMRPGGLSEWHITPYDWDVF